MATENLNLYYMYPPTASIAALEAVSTSGMVAGLIVEVTGVGFFATQIPATSTPDGLNIIAATDAGANWIRQTVPAMKATVTGLIDPSMLASIANNAVLTTNGSGVPSWNTTYIAPKATNIAGGLANEIAYQTAAGTTTFMSADDSAVLVTSSAGVPSLSTTLPAVDAGAILVTDPTTSTLTALDTTLSNVYNAIHASHEAAGTLVANSTSTAGQIVTGAELVLAAGTYLISYSASQSLTTLVADIGKAFTATAYIYNTTGTAILANTTFTSFAGFAVTGTEIFGGTATATVVATFAVPTTLDVYVQLSATSAAADTYTVNATITAVNLG